MHELVRQAYIKQGLDPDKYEAIHREAKEFEKKYYEEHAVCPECKTSNYSSTYIGYVLVIDDKETYKKYRDDNIANCECGWRGKVHDLVRCDNA